MKNVHSVEIQLWHSSNSVEQGKDLPQIAHQVSLVPWQNVCNYTLTLICKNGIFVPCKAKENFLFEAILLS